MNASAHLEDLFRQDYGRLLAALVRRIGDWERAEEGLQEAFLQALSQWSSEGLPDAPGAWLLTVAQRRSADLGRKDRLHEDRLSELRARLLQSQASSALVPRPDESPSDGIGDERLELLFTACHPAIAQEARVALALNALCGLDVAAIARAFLVAPSTMAQRLVRAKRKIREAGISLRRPTPGERPERLASVLDVLYLVFNEGYLASGGTELLRVNLCLEAQRLLEILIAPDSRCEEGPAPDAEALGLAALMRILEARRPARTDSQGLAVRLADQDRSRWQQGGIAQGRTLLHRALSCRRPGPFQVEASIAILHADATTYAATDWVQIFGLYEVLRGFGDSALLQLNQAVALGEAGHTAAALERVEGLLAGELQASPYALAAAAELRHRSGDAAGAEAAFAAAIRQARHPREAEWLRRRAATLRD